MPLKEYKPLMGAEVSKPDAQSWMYESYHLIRSDVIRIRIMVDDVKSQSKFEAWIFSVRDSGWKLLAAIPFSKAVCLNVCGGYETDLDKIRVQASVDEAFLLRRAEMIIFGEPLRAME